MAPGSRCMPCGDTLSRSNSGSRCTSCMHVMKRRSRVWQAQLRPVGTDHSEPLLSTVVATFKDFQTWPTMNIVFSFVVPEESAIAARANLCQLAVIGVGSKFRSAAAAKKLRNGWYSLLRKHSRRFKNPGCSIRCSTCSTVSLWTFAAARVACQFRGSHRYLSYAGSRMRRLCCLCQASSRQVLRRRHPE